MQTIKFALLLLAVPCLLLASTRIINGHPVEPGTHQEVVVMSSDGAKCTATIVGPRAILTAAHCADKGAIATFRVAGRDYSARMFHSPIYPGKDHDVAVGVTGTDIVGVEPVNIGGKASVGISIFLLGYGCTTPQGTGGNDGVLRIGETVITGYSNYDMVSQRPGGGALCYGDSGGPAFVVEGGKPLLLGINSKGDIKSTNLNTRTDLPDSVNFFKALETSQGIKICGVSSPCGSSVPPTPTAPTCTLTATPSSVKVGESVTLELQSTNAQSASIGGFAVTVPMGKRTVTAVASGTYSVAGVVNGQGGTGNCHATYMVEDESAPPSEVPELAVVPSFCGKNKHPESGVSRVCIAVLKRSAVSRDMNLSLAVTIRNSDGTYEVLPVLHKVRAATDPSDTQVKETFTLYANSHINAGSYFVLDTRTATLVSLPQSTGSVVPVSMTGKSAAGRFFEVDGFSQE